MLQPKHIEDCELCGKPCEFRVGCAQCGKLVCGSCLAAQPEDEQDERGEICEECF